MLFEYLAIVVPRKLKINKSKNEMILDVWKRVGARFFCIDKISRFMISIRMAT